jgi:hypothetical protein
MKKLVLLYIITVFCISAFVIGCQTYAPSNSVRTVSYDAKIKTDDVYDAIIDAARESSLPAMTKEDKADGIIEFGGFEGPELGLAAQVRIRSDNQLEITVKRGSVFVPMSADADADVFKNKVEARLIDLAKRENGANMNAISTSAH